MAFVTFSKAAQDVLAERERQISAEGWTPEHDDNHGRGEMAWAAACYAAPELIYRRDNRANAVIYADPWPWAERWDKRPSHGNVVLPRTSANPAASRDMLVKAAALLIAEIERQDRASTEEAS